MADTGDNFDEDKFGNAYSRYFFQRLSPQLSNSREV
jgi:hypothetical protein